jgi:cation diffusion facilitator CzcD-associated flavoprotein CzcO
LTSFKWAVIGAGPAGTAAVGRLLDNGISAEEIAWIDPYFAAGDLGRKWRAVSSNTKVALFLSFFESSPAFRFAEGPGFAIEQLHPEETCPLGMVADPLAWISQHLRSRVKHFETTATSLTKTKRQWVIETEQREIISANVILAVGATSKKLSFPHLDEIPLETVLDPQSLAELQLAEATVAVFGSSHSSMIALPNLLARPVRKVVNFYRSPLSYAVYLQDWILFDDTGLKGHAAQWARDNIEGVYPEGLERCWVDGPDFQEQLQACDRVVYTVGFERRKLPETRQWGPLDYNATNGIIAPGLFGLGIAYPQYATDPLGYGQYRVGLQKFMEYLDSVLPLWLRYGP